MENLIGKKFGNLTVISLYSKEPRIRNGLKDGYFYKYNCECDCGKKTIVSKEHLKSGHTKSCGCYHLKKISTIEGKYKDNKRLYYIWRGILSRCYNSNNPEYKNYGGRGINICTEWRKSFLNFYKWAISNEYKENLSIERKDVNKGYFNKNCCWIPLGRQEMNKRNSINIKFDGKTQCLELWCRELGIKRYLVYYFMKKYNIKHKEALLKIIGDK